MPRTHGETRDCQGCRFWSEMIARAGGGTDNAAGDVEALCLSPDGPLASKYTTARQTCTNWKSGHLGAVDDPPDYGESVRAAYEQEEKGEGQARCPTCGEPVNSIFDHVDTDCEHD